MVTIVDYGCGNLFSLMSSLRAIGCECRAAHTAEEVKKAQKLLLPGVGAFGAAAALLEASGMKKALIERAKDSTPLLGVCLGMQLLFEKSFEFGEHDGLGLLHGTIKPLQAQIEKTLKIPHMGWNALHLVKKDSPILQNTKENDFVYFVHSYYAEDCEDSLIATADYSIPIPAVVGKDRIFGTQFHPEKSGQVGLNILKAFATL